MVPSRPQQQQNYYPYPLSTSTINANVQFQCTSPIKTFNAPKVLWNSPEQLALTDWHLSEGEVHSDFNYFDYFASEETGNPSLSGILGMTGDIEGDSDFIGFDDIFGLDQNHQSQQVTNSETSNTSKEYSEDPLWGVLFDSWIHDMGHLLPNGPTATDIKPNVGNIPPNIGVHASSDVQMQPKQWDYQCHYCGGWIDGGIRRFAEHVRKMHQLKCTCGEEFSSSVDLREHIRLDNEAAAYIQKSNSATNLLPQHAVASTVRHTNGKAPFECDLCDRYFTNRAVAIKHRKLEHFSGVRARAKGLNNLSRGGTLAPNQIVTFTPPQPVRKAKPQETIVRIPEFIAVADYSKPKSSGLSGTPLNQSLPFSRTKVATQVPVQVQKIVATDRLTSSTTHLMPLDKNHDKARLLKRFACLLCHQDYTTKKSCRNHLRVKHTDMELDDYDNCIEDRAETNIDPLRLRVPQPRVQNRKREEIRTIFTATSATTSTSTTKSLTGNDNGIRRPVKRKLKDCGGEIIEFKDPSSGALPPEIILYNKTQKLGFEAEVPLQVHNQPPLPPYSSWAPKRNQRKTAHQQYIRELTESLRSAGAPGQDSVARHPNPLENVTDE